MDKWTDLCQEKTSVNNVKRISQEDSRAR